MDYSDKIVLLLKGLPRSGKSTIAKRLAKHKGWPIINPDSFRLAIHGQVYYGPAEPTVWANVKVAARALLLAGHTHIVIDATNMKRNRRDDWRRENWRVIVYELKTDMETCLKIASDTGRDDLIPVIERMESEHEPLESDEEKWDKLPLPGFELDFILTPVGEEFPENKDETPEKIS